MLAAASARYALRCGFRNTAVPLSFHPHLPVFEVFALPYRDAALQLIDGFQRGGEGCPAIRRGDHDGHAGFADQHPSEAVDHAHVPDVEASGELAPDLRHDLQRHRFVAFVIQAARAPAAGVVARHAFEGDYRAVPSAQYVRRQFAGVNGLAREREEVAVFRGLPQEHATAAAYRREQRDFVALAHRVSGTAELLIAGSAKARNSGLESVRTSVAGFAVRARAASPGCFPVRCWMGRSWWWAAAGGSDSAAQAAA